MLAGDWEGGWRGMQQGWVYSSPPPSLSKRATFYRFFLGGCFVFFLRFTLCWKKTNWLQTLPGGAGRHQEHWSRVPMHICRLLTCWGGEGSVLSDSVLGEPIRKGVLTTSPLRRHVAVAGGAGGAVRVHRHWVGGNGRR